MRDQQQRQNRIAAEAAAWLLRLQSESASTEARAEFVDWLRESPLHVAEMLRIARLRSALARFAEWEQIVPRGSESPPSSDLPVVALAAALGARGPAAPRALPGLKWGLAAAAAVAVLVVSIAVFAPGIGVKNIQTQLGERREMSLDDGSEIALAPDTEIQVRLDAKQRLVTLEHGEAFFHVRQDPNRPFLVDAGRARTRALGTSFSVERSSESVVVTVVEGRVAVSPGEGSGRFNSTAGGIALDANQQVAIAGNGTAAPVHRIDGRVAQAWSQGELVFENDTVATVVRRFNTYNQMKIRVADASLAARPVSGVFRATDPGSFVAFLESVAGVSIQRSGADEVVIESASAAHPEATPR